MLNAGDKLLNYEIIRPLGKGGSSDVYLARDMNLDMEVALKVLREDTQDLRTSMMVHRLRTGAKAAAHLRHPHIQQVLYQGVDPASDTPFVVMEYLPGGDLRARIGHLDLETALAIFDQICDAVAYAHDHGVIHRDLKPDNVLFNNRGEVVVTDFDLARVEGGVRRTQAGQTMGTLYYISPEQGRGDQIAHTTDIYALGVMLFELVTGTWPFTGKTAAEILRGHLQDQPPYASSLNPAVPEPIVSAIRRAMAKKPEDRFQSARDLAAAAHGHAAVEEPREPPPPEQPPAPAFEDDENIATVIDAGAAPAPAAPAPTAGAPTLKVANGPMAGQQFTLGPATALGANPTNDIVLEDEFVSGMHARIDREGEAYLLRDLKSTNGTLVNRNELVPYVPHTLQPGDVIELGDIRLEFTL